MFLFWGGEGGRVGYPGFICEVLVSEKWCCCFLLTLKSKKCYVWLCSIRTLEGHKPRSTTMTINGMFKSNSLPPCDVFCCQQETLNKCTNEMNMFQKKSYKVGPLPNGVITVVTPL